MLTKHEQDFMNYWEQNRLKQKRFFKQLAIGLPFGCIFAFAIFINVVSGWHVKASSALKASPSLILILLVAILAIVVFIAVYTVKHRWDINEQRYRELGGKTNKTTSEP